MFHLGSIQELISSWASLSLSLCLRHWIMAAASKIFCSACGSFFFPLRGFFFYWKKISQNLTLGLWKSAISYFELPWAHLCFLYQTVADLRCVFHSHLSQPCCRFSSLFFTFHPLPPWCFKSFQKTAIVLHITWPSLSGLLWKCALDQSGLSDPKVPNCDSEMKKMSSVTIVVVVVWVTVLAVCSWEKKKGRNRGKILIWVGLKLLGRSSDKPFVMLRSSSLSHNSLLMFMYFHIWSHLSFDASLYMNKAGCILMHSCASG